MALGATSAVAEELARLPGDVDEPLGGQLFPCSTGNVSPARIAGGGRDDTDVPSELKKIPRQLENPVHERYVQAVAS
jgi:hypothetical protein